MKPVNAKATMSPLVQRLLDEGHRFERLPDGRWALGGHTFSRTPTPTAPEPDPYWLPDADDETSAAPEPAASDTVSARHIENLAEFARTAPRTYRDHDEPPPADFGDAASGDGLSLANKVAMAVMEQREEVLRAFVAKYGFQPDEFVQVSQDGRWWVERRLSGQGDVERLVEAARTYFSDYCVDEAEDEFRDGGAGFFTGCSRDQHEAAVALREALRPFQQQDTPEQEGRS